MSGGYSAPGVTRSLAGMGDDYPWLMKLAVAAAIFGRAVYIDPGFDIFPLRLLCVVVALRSLLIREPGTLLGASRSPSHYHVFFGFTLAWFGTGLLWTWDRPSTVVFLLYLVQNLLLAAPLVKYVGGQVGRFDGLFFTAAVVLIAELGIGLVECGSSHRMPGSRYAAGSKYWTEIEEAPWQAQAAELMAPTGFHYNPNNFALVLNMMLPFCLLQKRWTVRIAAIVAIGAVICMTGSRGALATLTLLVLVAPLYGRRPTWVLAMSLVAALASQAILGGYLDWLTEMTPQTRELSGTVDALRNYITGEDEDSDGSIRARRELMANGMEALRLSRGLGIGGGADVVMQEKMGGVSGGYTAMHNMWVEMLVTGGYPFFAVLVAWYAALAWELFRQSRQLPWHSKEAYYTGAFSLAMVGFIPGAIPPSSAIYDPTTWLLLAMCVAAANVGRRALERNAPRHTAAKTRMARA